MQRELELEGRVNREAAEGKEMQRQLEEADKQAEDFSEEDYLTESGDKKTFSDRSCRNVPFNTW